MNIRDEVNKLISIWACSSSGYPTHLYVGKHQIALIGQLQSSFYRLFKNSVGDDTDITYEFFLGLEIVRVNRESYLSVGVIYD